MGVGLFWRPLGMPRAEARLLAIEEDRSRAFDLKPLGSLGGWTVVSGEEGRFDSSFAEAVAGTGAFARSEDGGMGTS